MLGIVYMEDRTYAGSANQGTELTRKYLDAFRYLVKLVEDGMTHRAIAEAIQQAIPNSPLLNPGTISNWLHPEKHHATHRTVKDLILAMEALQKFLETPRVIRAGLIHQAEMLPVLMLNMPQFLTAAGYGSPVGGAYEVKLVECTCVNELIGMLKMKEVHFIATPPMSVEDIKERRPDQVDVSLRRYFSIAVAATFGLFPHLHSPSTRPDGKPMNFDMMDRLIAYLKKEAKKATHPAVAIQQDWGYDYTLLCKKNEGLPEPLFVPNATKAFEGLLEGRFCGVLGSRTMIVITKGLLHAARRSSPIAHRLAHELAILEPTPFPAQAVDIWVKPDFLSEDPALCRLLPKLLDKATDYINKKASKPAFQKQIHIMLGFDALAKELEQAPEATELLLSNQKGTNIQFGVKNISFHVLQKLCLL